MAEPLYELYLEMTPDPGQRIPALATRSGRVLEDSIRQLRPDVWSAYNSRNTIPSVPAPIIPGSAADEIQRALAQQAQMFGGPIAGVTGGLSTTGEMPPVEQFGMSSLEPVLGGSTGNVTFELDESLIPASRGSGRDFYRGGGRGYAERRRAERERQASEWAELIAALGGRESGGGGGGYTPVTVDRSLFRLAETPEEQALLARELADIEARSDAGRMALTAGWARVADTNRAAAEKARAQVVSAGDAAAAGWTDAASRASELAAARAEQAGAFEGRQAINVSPTGGAEDFIMFMQSQAPAAAELARGRQETLASDLDWMAGMAGQQGEAYAADLQRQANVMAFESAREHNRAVQERINAERMALAQMEFQAATTNAQLAQAAARDAGRQLPDFEGSIITALYYGDDQGPAVLASLLGVSAEQALRLYRSAKTSPLGRSLQNQALPRVN